MSTGHLRTTCEEDELLSLRDEISRLRLLVSMLTGVKEHDDVAHLHSPHESVARQVWQAFPPFATTPMSSHLPNELQSQNPFMIYPAPATTKFLGDESGGADWSGKSLWDGLEGFA